MEKNLIKEQLELVESLIDKAGSKEVYLFLLGMKEALAPFRYLLDLIKLKGGDK